MDLKVHYEFRPALIWVGWFPMMVLKPTAVFTL